ncbi:MAG TPA: hypothetical protein VFL79_17225 [Terriglobia bacterium]|nr:hypothetical protein [Terriglobia bacterium]
MRKMRLRHFGATGLCIALLLCLGARPAAAQVNARLLLVSGSAVPSHPGFTFGPFQDLAMSGNDRIVFRSTLASPRSNLQAVVRSQGVSFTVVAFEGLISPASHEQYESFSAPSINSAGDVAFKAKLKAEEADKPTEAIVCIKGSAAGLVADNGGGGNSFGQIFKEFSAPVMGSQGEVLFAARSGGPNPHSGLYIWSGGGMRQVSLPKDFRLAPSSLLEPIFASHDEAVFVRHGADLAEAREQFFRAVATRTFQQLNPAPQPPDTVQVLPARSNQKPIQMLLVLLQGNNAETAELSGDPSQPVMAQKAPGASDNAAFSAIQGQAAGRISGSIIFAGEPSGQADDFGLFCFCGGQVVRLTTPSDFGLLLNKLGGRPITSFAGDGQGTVALVAPVGAQAGATAIFVCDTP